MTSRWRPPSNAITYPRRRGDWTIAHATGGYSAFSPDTGTIAVTEPRQDKELPALATVLDRGRLVSYRVGRRAVVATDATYVKVVRPSRLAAVWTAHRLAEVATSVRTPTVIKAEPLGSIELTPMRGPSLHELIQRGAFLAEDIAALARNLAYLHANVDSQSLPLRHPDPPQRWIDTVARVDRVAAGHFAKLARQLPSTDPGDGSVIHGDLHDKNIYIDSDRAGFIDLDGLSRGGAEHDLANLVVHMKLRSLQSGKSASASSKLTRLLYREYGSLRPFDRDLALAVEKHTWFRLACLYLLRTPNCGLTARIVNELSVR